MSFHLYSHPETPLRDMAAQSALLQVVEADRHLAREVLNDIRQHLARHSSEGFNTPWGHAWNEVSSARPGRPGVLKFHAHITCRNCNGKRIDMRRGQACLTCMARGRIYEQVTVSVTAVVNPDDGTPY